MKIVMTNTADNTRKVVKFGELIKHLRENFPVLINSRWINYKLLNGDTISVNGHEYKREI